MIGRFLLVLLALLPLLAVGGMRMTIEGDKEYFSSAFLGNVQEYPLSDFAVVFGRNELCVTITSRIVKGDELIISGKTDDDTAMFRGETAELFLVPAPASGVYYHFAVNPAGICYTAKGRDFSWTPEFPRPEICRKEDLWQVKFRIPYQAVNSAPPTAGAVWKANFAVSKRRRQSGAVNLNWSGATNYHDVTQFGDVHFSPVAGAEIKHCAIKNDTLEIDLDRVGDLRISGENNGKVSEFSGGKIRIPLKSSYLKLKQVTPVGLVLTGKDGRKVQSWQFAIHRSEDKDLTLDRFYVKPGEKVGFTHTFPGKAVLKIFDQEHRLLKEYSPVPKQGKISLSGIAPQRLIVEIADEKNRLSRLLILTEADFAPPAMADGGKFSVDGKFFFYNGEPLFLIGSNNTPHKHLHQKETFNLNCGNFGFLKNAVRLQSLPGSRLIRKPTVGFLLVPDWKKRIFAAAGKMDGNSFARICYEAQLDLYLPDGSGMKKSDPAAFYRELYRDLKAQYPDKLFSIHCDQSEELEKFSGSCDILEGAFWSSSYARNMMPELITDLRRMRSAAGNKPAIFWLGGSIPNARCRTAEELRAGVYGAVFHDMAGVIIHLGHGGLPADRARLWSLISGINADVQQWYPAFRKGRKVPVAVHKFDRQVYCTAWEYENRTYIGVINLSGGENRLELITGKGKVSLLLTPMEARVFIQSK